MKFSTHILTTPLKNYIESIFHYKGFTPDHSIERVVPTGHLFILFELDGIARYTYDSETLEANGEFNKVWVSGIHKNYLSISAPQNSEMLVIQFKPTGAHPFIQRGIDELNNKVVGAEELFGVDILELRDLLLITDSSEEKFKLVENWLLKEFEADRIPGSELVSIFNAIAHNPVEEYEKNVNSYSKTHKHLINQFKKHFGLTPKDFQRIFRFNKIVQQIQHKEEISWSQIAYTCGYTDQSHFIKEFKKFSGFNPQEFIVNDFNKEETNFFPLDRKG